MEGKRLSGFQWITALNCIIASAGPSSGAFLGHSGEGVLVAMQWKADCLGGPPVVPTCNRTVSSFG